jgi:hypothetical protein
MVSMASVNAHSVTGQTLVVDVGLATKSPLGHTAPPVAVEKLLGDEKWWPTKGGSDQ